MVQNGQKEAMTSISYATVVLRELCAGFLDWIWGMDTGWREGTCV